MNAAAFKIASDTFKHSVLSDDKIEPSAKINLLKYILMISDLGQSLTQDLGDHVQLAAHAEPGKGVTIKLAEVDSDVAVGKHAVINIGVWDTRHQNLTGYLRHEVVKIIGVGPVNNTVVVEEMRGSYNEDSTLQMCPLLHTVWETAVKHNRQLYRHEGLVDKLQKLAHANGFDLNTVNC